jgi:hypothetical protein
LERYMCSHFFDILPAIEFFFTLTKLAFSKQESVAPIRLCH